MLSPVLVGSTPGSPWCGGKFYMSETNLPMFIPGSPGSTLPAMRQHKGKQLPITFLRNGVSDIFKILINDRGAKKSTCDSLQKKKRPKQVLCPESRCLTGDAMHSDRRLRT